MAKKAHLASGNYPLCNSLGVDLHLVVKRRDVTCRVCHSVMEAVERMHRRKESGSG